MSCCLWDTTLDEPLMNRYEHHSEFVLGFDFNLFHEGEMASCGWDNMVYTWNMGEIPAR